MPTGKEVSLNNFMVLMNFADTEFNRIYNTLLQAEMLNPGAATAMLQDIRAQEISIREERKDLSRIFAEGMKIDADALTTIRKAQLDMEVARTRAETDIKVQQSRAALGREQILADLRTSFDNERRTATDKGSTSAFRVGERDLQTLTATPARSDSLSPSSEAAAKQQLDRRASELLNDVFGSEFAKAGDAYEKRAFLDAAKGEVAKGLGVFSSVGTYGTQLGDNLGSAIDEAVDKAFESRVRDVDAQIKKEEKAEQEIINDVQAVGPGNIDFAKDLYPALKVKAEQLGVDPSKADTILSRVGKADPKYNDIVLEAAVNARSLPTLAEKTYTDVTIDGDTYRYVDGLKIKDSLAAFDSPQALREALDAGDPEAIALYDRVLSFQPSQIKLLQEGDYPRRLFENELDAINLETERRQTKQKMMEGQDVNVLALHNKAMRIYQDLYGPKTPKMDVRRTAQRIRETYEDDQVAEVLRKIAKEDGFSARQINKLDKTIRKMEKAETVAELVALRREANKIRIGGLAEVKFKVQGEEYTLPQLKAEVDRQFEAGEYTDERQKAAFDQTIGILERAIDEGTLDRRAIRQTQRAFDFMAEDVLRKEEEPQPPGPGFKPRIPQIEMPTESVIDEQAAARESSDEERALAAAFESGMTSPTNNPNSVGDQARPAAMHKVGKGVVSMTTAALSGKGGSIGDRKEVAQQMALRSLEEQGVSPETIKRASRYRKQYGDLYRMTEDQGRITMSDLAKIDPMINQDLELATAASLFGTVDAAFPDDQA
jgi:hypothetical protein